MVWKVLDQPLQCALRAALLPSDRNQTDQYFIITGYDFNNRYISHLMKIDSCLLNVVDWLGWFNSEAMIT